MRSAGDSRVRRVALDLLAAGDTRGAEVAQRLPAMQSAGKVDAIRSLLGREHTSAPALPAPYTPTGGGDLFDRVGGLTDQLRHRVVTDMAQSQGDAAAHTGIAQATVDAHRAGALQAQAARAPMFNVPGALVEENRAIISGPYDRYAADASQAGGAHKRALDRMGSAGDLYLREVAAGLPVQRAIGDRQRADIEWEREQRRLEAEERARDREHSALMRQLQLDLARMEAEERAGGGLGDDDLSDSELRTRLMGAARLQRDEGVQRAVAMPGASTGAPGLGGFVAQGIRKVGAIGRELGTPLERRATDIADAAGIDPFRARGVIGEPTPPKASAKPKQPRLKTGAVGNISAPEVQRIKGTPYYDKIAKGVKARVGATVDDKGTPYYYEDLVDDLRDQFGTSYPKSVKIVLAEWGHLFPRRPKGKAAEKAEQKRRDERRKRQGA